MINTSTLVPTGTSRVPNWVSGGSYVIGDQAISPITLIVYARKTNGGGATDPSADGTNWQPIGLTIKSIQRGVIGISNPSVTGTATISAVVTSKSIIMFLGATNSTNSGGVTGGRVALTNSTTVTASADVVGAGVTTIGYQVVEYY